MSNALDLRRAWNHVHQAQPASTQPDEGMLAFIEHAANWLSREARVLDAGCGRGRNALHFSQLGFNVWACDLSPVAIQIARERAQGAGVLLRFQTADLGLLPYASDSFTVVLCVHVLPYQLKAGLIQGVRELRRVLRPNGWLYFDLLDLEDAEYGRGPRLEEHTFLDLDGIPGHFSSREEIDELSEGLALQHLSRTERNPSSGHRRVVWAIWAAKSEN